MKLEKYSIGTGDRFGKQAEAQLDAVINARENGIPVAIIWNKSHREHTTIGSEPADVLKSARKAVTQLDYNGPYYIDADHIGLANVELFVDSSTFFTLDVADFTGNPAPPEDIENFVKHHLKDTGSLKIEGIENPVEITEETLRNAANKYLLAVNEAGKIYDFISKKKEPESFITEVSMDETENPQSPTELLLILAMIRDRGIPAQTIAPKFSGRFNKGVDYIGNVETFTREFEDDLAVIEYAKKKYNLPKNLKLSVHSGSDKFSIYHSINLALKKFDAGLHLKTAGTSWLEEVIGLAEADGDGLNTAKEIYKRSLKKFDELCAPYAPVIDIDQGKLPSAEEIDNYTGADFADALRHNPDNPHYNPHLRQLIHVGYKVAAEMGETYLTMLEKYKEIISKNVTYNIYERHIKKIFG